MTSNELKLSSKKEAQLAGEATKTEKHFSPAVDIYETEQEVVVQAELPGVDKEHVEINLENGVLTIRGTTTYEPAAERYLLQEFESGHYIRRFSLAETIEQEKIGAVMSDGILTVTLPKTQPAKPKKIAIATD